MKISDTYVSTYMKASNFPTPRTLIVEAVTEAKFEEGPKPVIRFRGESQLLVLNRTNAFVLATAFGDETDLWIGKHIHVSTAPIHFQGKQKRTFCIEPVAAPGDGNTLTPSAPPSEPSAPQPAPQQLPPNQIPAAQQPTPQVEAPLQAPRIDYEA